MIQLSLFPERGFGLVGTPGLVEDWSTGEPLFVRTRRTALRYAKQLAWGNPRVVRLERHDPHPSGNYQPTYVINNTP
jgi:hypothetical protein